jgi:Xaa-Pro aminopeptidase
MKSDIDALMKKRGLDAIFVTGGEGQNMLRHYMTNGAHISGGYVIQKYGAKPMLIINPMEAEEAKKSGYAIRNYKELGAYSPYYLPPQEQIEFWATCLREAGIDFGRIGVYGQGEIETYIELVQLANTHFEQYQFVGETGLTLFEEAFITKDAAEIETLKRVAVHTNEAMAAAWDFIASHKADASETVVKADGSPLTIGDVKRLVRVELLKRDLQDTGMIFAQGRDAGFPHSHGEDAMPLKLGQPIVFDLFPHEIGGGYYHDMTRTWCIGYAPPEVQQTYDEVMQAFDISLEMFGVGKPLYVMQEAVQDFFESKGHATSRSNPKTMEGYVHGLGHGLGLNIHERPSISHILRDDVWQAGNVVTIEPGLYYPDKGIGMRIEDMFIVSETGELISYTPFKKDLVLPLNGA